MLVLLITKFIDIPSGVSFEDFDNIASIFNHYLKGKRLSDISMASIRKIRGETVNSTVFNAIINIIDEALAKDKQERLYLGGARELMEQPEFHNIDKVKNYYLCLKKNNFYMIFCMHKKMKV